MSARRSISVLIIEKTREECDILAMGLSRSPTVSHAFAVTNIPDALRLLSEHTFDAILFEPLLPYYDGLYLLTELRKRNIHPHLILLTALLPEYPIVRQYMHYGVGYVIMKPYTVSCVLNALELMRQAEPLAQERVNIFLLENGFRLKLIGAQYIRAAAGLLQNDRDIRMKTLYHEIAGMYNTTPDCVDSAIRTAIRKAYDADGLRMVCADGSRPSSKEFFYWLRERLA